MKSFREFLQEKDVASLDSKTNIYENPSSSDLAKLNKERCVGN